MSDTKVPEEGWGEDHAADGEDEGPEGGVD